MSTPEFPLPKFPTLKADDRGSAVKLLQIRLGQLKADGVFGPATDARLRAVQAHLGLEADGLAGVQTMAALDIAVQLGIDVSHHQGLIDWRQVADVGIRWVAIKATEGRDFTDPRWVQNATRALEVGCKVHPYHFATPSTAPRDPELEAEHLFATVFDLHDRLEFAPDGAAKARLAEQAIRNAVLDIEPARSSMSPWQLVDWCQRFGREYQRLSGSLPLLYTYSSFLLTKLGGAAALSDAGWQLWISRVGGPSKVHPGLLGVWDWDVWQWTWNGQVPGIWRAVDLNWVLPSRSRVQPLRLPTDPQPACGEDD